jgi:uncharacterized protein (TIGR00251 family)
MRSRTFLYSGRYLPACLISQTGVYSVFSRRKARKKVSLIGFMKNKPEKNLGSGDCRTATTPAWLSQSEDGAFYVLVHAQPGAKKDRVSGEFNSRLKIALAAPPVDGKANAALQKFLSKRLGVAKSAVTLASGETMRDKRLRITGVTAEQLIGLLSGEP